MLLGDCLDALSAAAPVAGWVRADVRDRVLRSRVDSATLGIRSTQSRGCEWPGVAMIAIDVGDAATASGDRAATWQAAAP